MNPTINLKGLAQALGNHALGIAEKKSGIPGLGEVAQPLVNGLMEHFQLASMEIDPILFTMGRLAFMGIQAQKARTAQAEAMRLAQEKKE
jgi:hypothetical protein